MRRGSFPLPNFKLDLKMKLSALFIALVLFQVTAGEGYSQGSKITIEMEGATVREALRKIESKTDFRFLYSRPDIDLDRKVTLRAENKTIKYVLRNLFKNSATTFAINANQIVLKARAEKGRTKPMADLPIPSNLSMVQFSVSGTVTDANGSPLPGASIVEKGTTNGTQTDFDGNFTLNVASEEAILTISYIGFSPKDIAINGQTQITVSLEESAAGLDEVIVVGYGTQSRRNVTAAIATVDTEDAQKISNTNTASLLQGRAAGVNVENSGGAPGTGAVVVIRGSGTLNNDQPLYVVDGNFADDISFISPNDIESIQILKDAAAASIYGSRAANGVVIVTTKRGRSGEIQIDFSSKLGIQTPTNRLDFLGAEEYVQVRNQANANGGNVSPVLSTNGIDTDWQDVQLSSALFQDYNLSISGGGENATFYLSGQYLDQEGMVNSSGYERYNVRANSSFRKGRFKVEESLFLSREIQDTNPVFMVGGGAIPIQPVFDENNPDGGWGLAPPEFTGNATNYFGFAESQDQEAIRDRVIFNISPSYEILNGLTYKYNLGINYSLFHNRNFVPVVNTGANPIYTTIVATLNESFTRVVDVLSEHTLSFSKEFGNHNLSLLGGYTTQNVKSRSAGGIVQEFPSDALTSLNAGNVETATFGSEQRNALVSWIGRLDYIFKDKYLLGATIRNDKSSRFAEDLRSGNFPSFSAAWRISEEGFFPKDGAVTELKLRGSWGQLGNQAIGNFDIQSTLNNQNFAVIGGEPLVGSTILNLANPELFWETTTSTNIGVDLELFDGKVGVVADYFIKETEDILVNLPIPAGGGQGGSLRTNAADVENRGFEFLVNYRNSWDDFNLNASLNFTTLTNEVTGLGEGVSPIPGGRFNAGGQFATLTDVGQEIGSYYGFVVEGVYQTDAEIAADGRTGVAQLGDLNFRDLDNDGDIDEDDRDFLGSAIPDFQLGLNVNASYKNFDLNMFWTSVQGVELFNARINDFFFETAGGSDIFSFARNAWSPTNTNTNIPRMVDGNPSGNDLVSSFYVEDGSYTRLKNIEIGYTIPEGIFPENTFKRLRVYLSGQNLITFTDYSGYDPEVGRSFNGNNVGSSNSNIFGAGIDRSYPTAKMVFFGLQASF